MTVTSLCYHLCISGLHCNIKTHNNLKNWYYFSFHNIEMLHMPRTVLSVPALLVDKGG